MSVATEKPLAVKIDPESTSGPEAESDNESSGDLITGRWSLREDQALKTAVEEIGARNWKRIASEYLDDKRTDVQCLHRWQKVLRPGLVKGPWTPDEDNTIRNCMKNGITRWSEIAKQVPGRIGKQCRERWFNHLDPNIKKGDWTPEEDQQLILGQAALGNKWSEIAKYYLPGRPENAVKNRWNAATRRKRGAGDGSPLASQALIDAATRSVGNAVSPSSQSLARTPMAAGPGKQVISPGSKKKKGLSELEGAGSALEGLAGICAAVEPEASPSMKKIKGATKAEKAALKRRLKEEKKLLKMVEKEAKRQAKRLAKEKKKGKSNGSKTTDAEDKKSPSKKRNLVDVTFGAAALLSAAAELQEQKDSAGKEESSKRQKRGSSFIASRPNLVAPSISMQKVKGDTNNMATPSFNGLVQGSSISPMKIVDAAASVSLSALQFLSTVSSSIAESRPKRSQANQ